VGSGGLGFWVLHVGMEFEFATMLLCWDSLMSVVTRRALRGVPV